MRTLPPDRYALVCGNKIPKNQTFLGSLPSSLYLGLALYDPGSCFCENVSGFEASSKHGILTLSPMWRLLPYKLRFWGAEGKTQNDTPARRNPGKPTAYTGSRALFRWVHSCGQCLAIWSIFIFILLDWRSPKRWVRCTSECVCEGQFPEGINWAWKGKNLLQK